MVLPVVLTFVARCVDPQRVFEFCFPLGHALTDLVTEVPDRRGQLGRRLLHGLRGEHLRTLLQPGHRVDTHGDPDDQPEDPLHRFRAFRSAFISSFTRRLTSRRWLSPSALRTPYVNAAAFTNGPPAVAENSDTSAAALV